MASTHKDLSRMESGRNLFQLEVIEKMKCSFDDIKVLWHAYEWKQFMYVISMCVLSKCTHWGGEVWAGPWKVISVRWHRAQHTQRHWVYQFNSWYELPCVSTTRKMQMDGEGRWKVGNSFKWGSRSWDWKWPRSFIHSSIHLIVILEGLLCTRDLCLLLRIQ